MTQVEVNVLAKGLKKDQVSVSIEPQRLRVAINNLDGEPLVHTVQHIVRRVLVLVPTHPGGPHRSRFCLVRFLPGCEACLLSGSWDDSFCLPRLVVLRDVTRQGLTAGVISHQWTLL